MNLYIRWFDDSLLDIFPISLDKSGAKKLVKKLSHSRYNGTMKFELVCTDIIEDKYYSDPVEVTEELAEHIIMTYKPKGLFYLRGKDMYIGIDNSTGDAFTEEFQSKIRCIRWLGGESLDSESNT